MRAIVLNASRVLDWEGNLRRVKESIRIAKEAGATLRVGPEVCCATQLYIANKLSLRFLDMDAWIISKREIRNITLGK
jgi:predicted amidohydrolase